MFRQVELRSGDDRLTCWLEEQPGLKERARLTLKGDARTWTVEHIFSMRLERPPQKDWKVGGLVD
jgi:hypothetical protein